MKWEHFEESFLVGLAAERLGCTVGNGRSSKARNINRDKMGAKAFFEKPSYTTREIWRQGSVGVHECRMRCKRPDAGYRIAIGVTERHTVKVVIHNPIRIFRQRDRLLQN